MPVSVDGGIPLDFEEYLSKFANEPEAPRQGEVGGTLHTRLRCPWHIDDRFKMKRPDKKGSGSGRAGTRNLFELVGNQRQRLSTFSDKAGLNIAKPEEEGKSAPPSSNLMPPLRGRWRD
jgi:hypothetical protein